MTAAARIDAYYDTSDPGNHGWAYHTYDATGAELDSGALDETDRDADLCDVARECESLADGAEIRVYSGERLRLTWRSEDDYRWHR